DDLEEDLDDYPANRDDDDEEEEEEPSRDDADDEDQDEDEDDEEEEEPSRDDADDEDQDEDEDEEEEEEHPAPADSDPPVHKVERLLALTTPPPSPLTPLSSLLPQIPFPPLPASPPASVLPASPPASPIRSLGYRAAMIQMRAKAASTSHSLPLPPPIILSHTRTVAPSWGTPPLHLLSTDHREDRPKVCLPPRKRLCPTHGPRYEIGESSAAAAARPIGGCRADYGFVNPREAVEEVAPMTLKGVNTRVTELATVQEQDTQDIYAAIGDTQDRLAIWHVQRLCSVVIGQQAVISQLQAADRRSQTVTSKILQADRMRQAEIAALRTFDRTRQEQLMQTLTLMQSL
ncbi:hypothetical protein Tco_1288558, partial [Tanacetum coccineum]